MFLDMPMYLRQKADFRNNMAIKILLFILNPLASFLYSLKNPRSQSSYVIYFLFGLLFAWVIDYSHGNMWDYCRVANLFYKFKSDNAFDELLAFFEGSSHLTDIYQHILFYISHALSENYHLFFFLASFLFLYFMLKSMKYITNDINIKVNNRYLLIVLLLFILPYNFWFFIVAPRFPTAVWISIYVIFKVFYDNERKYLLLLLMIPWIHSAFIVIVGLILAFYFIPKNEKLLIRAYYITIPLLFISTGLISYIDTSILPDSIARWANVYLSETSQKTWGMNAVGGTGFYWVSILFRNLKIITYTIGFLMLIRKINTNNKLRKLFLLVLFIGVVSNVIYVIPVLGGRVREIWRILFIFLWFKTYNDIKYKSFIYVILFSCVYDILYLNGLYLFDVLDFNFLYMNVFSLIVGNWGVYNYINSSL